MSRKIIKIDEEKCVGCGLCANRCEQSAIAIIDGKAKVVRDDYCDGMGNCLPVCPVGAISFSERDIINVSGHKPALQPINKIENISSACSGSKAKNINRAEKSNCKQDNEVSELRQWPVQIKLVPPNAPYFDGANLLIAADCSAYAYANFHAEFMKNKVTLIGCPKLDEGDYTEKLSKIIAENNIKSVTAVRMEVPCCGGLEKATINALKASGKFIPWQIIVLSTDGQILQRL